GLRLAQMTSLLHPLLVRSAVLLPQDAPPLERGFPFPFPFPPCRSQTYVNPLRGGLLDSRGLISSPGGSDVQPHRPAPGQCSTCVCSVPLALMLSSEAHRRHAKRYYNRSG